MERVKYDLHVHTTASDGVLTPQEVVKLAKQCGLCGIAITDHDTVEGLMDSHLSEVAADNNMQVIPGIEINTDFENEEVHILGYFIDVENSYLLNRLEAIKSARLERTSKIVKRLHEIGITISPDRINEVAGTGTVGRPHIAQVMIENGYCGTIKEVFEKYLGRGKPAYVPRYRLSPEEAIVIIENAGGIPILAHPGLIKNREVIDKILQMGIKGLEVFYPEHTSTETNDLLELAHNQKLLITGGSDFHGTENTRNQLGCAGINCSYFKQFIEHTLNTD